MAPKMVDVTLHLDEDTSHEQREALRDKLLQLDGVMAADYHDDRPHLLILEYDPDTVSAGHFLSVVKDTGLHGELVGL